MASGRTIAPPTPAASAACWQARLSDCDCPTAESRDTVITLAGSSAFSCYCGITPRFEQKRVDRARDIGGSPGTGGPSGVIAQTDLSDWATPATLATLATVLGEPKQSKQKQQAWNCSEHGRSKCVSRPRRRWVFGALTTAVVRVGTGHRSICWRLANVRGSAALRDSWRGSCPRPQRPSVTAPPLIHPFKTSLVNRGRQPRRIVFASRMMAAGCASFDAAAIHCCSDTAKN